MFHCMVPGDMPEKCLIVLPDALYTVTDTWFEIPEGISQNIRLERYNTLICLFCETSEREGMTADGYSRDNSRRVSKKPVPTTPGHRVIEISTGPIESARIKDHALNPSRQLHSEGIVLLQESVEPLN